MRFDDGNRNNYCIEGSGGGINSSRAKYAATEEVRVMAVAFIAVIATTLTSINDSCKDVDSCCGNGNSGGKGKGDGNGNGNRNGNSSSNGDGDSDVDGNGESDMDRNSICNRDGNGDGI